MQNPRLASLVALGLLGTPPQAGPARAMDVTACGQVVPERDTGVLQVDLSGCTTAVSLDDRAILQMNGHVIADSSESGIDCLGRRCTVVGPGEIARGLWGVRESAPASVHPRIYVQDLDIHDTTGAGLYAQGAMVRATSVRLTHCASAGGLTAQLEAERIRGTDLVVTGSGYVGISAHHVRITRLTATGNYWYGVDAPDPVGHVRLVSSTVTDNNATGGGIDLWAFNRPKLVDTTCGYSGGPDSHYTWCVCQGDPPPPYAVCP